VDQAIRQQLASGIIFGHPHPLECLVAEQLAKSIPCAERVRFLKTGGEAVAACMRLARSHTGRDHVVQIGYNGWINSLAGGARFLPNQTAASIPPGVPAALSELHHACGWNDTETLEKLFSGMGDRIAALVVAADYSRLEEGKTFYPFLRKLADRYGTVLIFDEIVTGFRVALAGVQEFFGVTPDLAVFAKGVANGMPLSVYCGRAEIMDRLDRTVVSSTYGGEVLSLAAARATIETYLEKDVVDHLWSTGGRFKDGLGALFAEFGLPVSVRGFPPCFMIVPEKSAPPDLGEKLFRAAYRHGVSLYSVVYANFSHQESDIDETLERLKSAVKSL
jgi:glutamate-1-semialdehyde 2,1-aminomutase